MTAARRTLATLVTLLATALLSLGGSAQQAAQNPRIALVIGNATYRDAALATTANDAGLVAQTLQAAGFDVVGARDLDSQSLRTAFRDFLDKASAAGPDMQAFVYLAGRGVQYNGDNYFVPVDAQINRDADVPIDALRISDFAHALAQTPGKARIIVLDLARANPYASQGPPLAPGLALVDPEPGELIAFNAAPGTLAGDEQGPYGVYGKTLAGAMRQGGVDIAEVFDQTRVTVNQLAQGALVPWSASKLTEPYYIFERAADAPPPAVAAVANQSIAGLPPDAAYAAALLLLRAGDMELLVEVELRRLLENISTANSNGCSPCSCARALGLGASELEKGTGLIAFADTLSLALCGDLKAPLDFETPARGGDALGMRLAEWPGSSFDFVLSPWPFRTNELVAEGEARPLPNMGRLSDEVAIRHWMTSPDRAAFALA